MIFPTLSTRLSKADVLHASQLFSPNQLVELIHHSNPRIACNAAWILSHTPTANRHLLIPFREQLIDTLLATPNSSLQRILLSILIQLPTPPNTHINLLNYCFSNIPNATILTAIRAHSIRLAYQLAKPHPELLHELNAILTLLPNEELQPAIKISKINILKKINHD